MDSSIYNSIKEQETLITDSFSCIEDGDWHTCAGYYVPKIRDELNAFLSNPMNHEKHVGILNVTSANVTNIYPIEDYRPYASSYGIEEEDYNGISAFLVNVNIKAYQPDKYYQTGQKYMLVLLVEQNGRWYKYAETDANDMQITDVLGQNGICYTPPLSQTISPQAILKMPDTMRLYNNGAVTRVGFITYIERVMTAEFNYDIFVPEARKAVAMAIKTYTWYHTIHPKHGIFGADLCTSSDCCQGYKTEIPTQKNRAAVSAILNTQVKKTVSGFSESGYIIASNGIWESWYIKGSESGGNYKAGRLWQLGAQYLASQLGYDYITILKYYYNNITEVPCSISPPPPGAEPYGSN